MCVAAELSHKVHHPSIATVQYIQRPRHNPDLSLKETHAPKLLSALAPVVRVAEAEDGILESAQRVFELRRSRAQFLPKSAAVARELALRLPKTAYFCSGSTLFGCVQWGCFYGLAKRLRSRWVAPGWPEVRPTGKSPEHGRSRLGFGRYVSVPLRPRRGRRLERSQVVSAPREPMLQRISD